MRAQPVEAQTVGDRMKTLAENAILRSALKDPETTPAVRELIRALAETQAELRTALVELGALRTWAREVLEQSLKSVPEPQDMVADAEEDAAYDEAAEHTWTCPVHGPIRAPNCMACGDFSR